VLGVLAPVPLAPEIDEAAMVGYPAAGSLLGFDGFATKIYVRTDPDQVIAVEQVPARTTNPDNPVAVSVSRPSDVLAARAAAKGAFTGLFLGLGAVALLVGGVGAGNVMVISVIERRSEIGLRRALGATRGQVGVQFVTESLLLCVAGGALGALLGVAATAAYAMVASLPLSIPPVALYSAVASALTVGALAGLYPALRATRLAPAEVLRSA
jgi:putative ABC transport system permease protein